MDVEITLREYLNMRYTFVWQRKNWKRRFFVLKKQGFAYYKSEHVSENVLVVCNQLVV